MAEGGGGGSGNIGNINSNSNNNNSNSNSNDGGNSRNFRSSYYEKLGFCGNEEKNILDLLIASCPYSLEKLNEFCERFDFDRRCLETWKILLGVECDRKNPFDEFANVRRVRAEHFQSLKHNLEVLLRHNVVISNRLKKCSKNLEPPQSKPLDNHKHSQENCNHHDPQQPPHHQHLDTEGVEHNDANELTRRHSNELSNGGVDGQENYATTNNNGVANHQKNSEEENVNASIGNHQQTSHRNINHHLKNIMTNPGRQITLMYLLEAGKLDSSDIDAQLESTYCQKLSAMASFFANVSVDPQEAFFLFRNFVRKLEENEALDKSSPSKNKT